MLPLWEATKVRPTGRSRSSSAALAVSIDLVRRIDHPEARRSHNADGRWRAQRRAQPRLARETLRAGFGEAVGEHGCHLHPELCAFLDRLDGGIGGQHDVGVVRSLGQRGNARPGALAEHGLPPGIYRVDPTGVAHLAQEFQRAPRGFAGIIGLSDDGDRAGREQILRQL